MLLLLDRSVILRLCPQHLDAIAWHCPLLESVIKLARYEATRRAKEGMQNPLQVSSGTRSASMANLNT